MQQSLVTNIDVYACTYPPLQKQRQEIIDTSPNHTGAINMQQSLATDNDVNDCTHPPPQKQCQVILTANPSYTQAIINHESFLTNKGVNMSLRTPETPVFPLKAQGTAVVVIVILIMQENLFNCLVAMIGNHTIIKSTLK
jgi:hypothetical protein